MLGVKLDALTRKEAVDRVRELLFSNQQHLIVTPNPEMLVVAHGDSEFQKILNTASLKLPDGIGLVLLGRLPERITGTDFLDDLMCLAEETGHKVGFLGGQGEVPELARDHFRKRYSGLRIVHAESGGEIKERWQMDSGLLTRIQNTKPDILVVALGHKKQELWIKDHLSKLPSVKIAIGVGGALDFWAGQIRRAPKIMRKLGLEWLWRLFLEPCRWRRIFTAVIIFPYLVIKQKL